MEDLWDTKQCYSWPIVSATNMFWWKYAFPIQEAIEAKLRSSWKIEERLERTPLNQEQW